MVRVPKLAGIWGGKAKLVAGAQAEERGIEKVGIKPRATVATC